MLLTKGDFKGKARYRTCRAVAAYAAYAVNCGHMRAIAVYPSYPIHVIGASRGFDWLKKLQLSLVQYNRVEIV